MKENYAVRITVDAASGFEYSSERILEEAINKIDGMLVTSIIPLRKQGIIVRYDGAYLRESLNLVLSGDVRLLLDSLTDGDLEDGFLEAVYYKTEFSDAFDKNVLLAFEKALDLKKNQEWGNSKNHHTRRLWTVLYVNIKTNINREASPEQNRLFLQRLIKNYLHQASNSGFEFSESITLDVLAERISSAVWFMEELPEAVFAEVIEWATKDFYGRPPEN